MKSGPSISVLMTAYNRERYIAEAIDSVLGQTFTDFELVIVDDRSTDRTLEIARSYTARDPRVRVEVNDTRLGDYPNRNRAAALARGKYLKYHDSDDVMYPHCLDVMFRMLDAHPSASFALSAAVSWPGGPCPMLLTPKLSFEREFLGQGLFFGGPGTALFRADDFRAFGGFPDGGHGSDYLFWLRACQQFNVLLVPADLFYWRVHPGQEFEKPTSLPDKARVSGEAWRVLNDPGCPLTGEALRQARRNWAFVVVRGVVRQLRAGAWRTAWDIWRHSGLSVADLVRYLRRPRRSRFAGVPASTDGRA